MCACSLLPSPQQNEQERGSCAYLNNTRKRRRRPMGVWTEAVRYGVTSLPAMIAIPERLLTLKRGHWIIENGLHYVKDVTMGEDKSTLHRDNGPKIMAAL